MPTRRTLRRLYVEILGALEVAITGRATPGLVEELAATAGLLAALSELPPREPMAPIAVERAKRALAAWLAWQRTGARSVAGA